MSDFLPSSMIQSIDIQLLIIISKVMHANREFFFLQKKWNKDNWTLIYR